MPAAVESGAFCCCMVGMARHELHWDFLQRGVPALGGGWVGACDFKRDVLPVCPRHFDADSSVSTRRTLIGGGLAEDGSVRGLPGTGNFRRRCDGEAFRSEPGEGSVGSGRWTPARALSAFISSDRLPEQPRLSAGSSSRELRSLRSRRPLSSALLRCNSARGCSCHRDGCLRGSSRSVWR